MKKYLPFLFSFILIFLFCGCDYSTISPKVNNTDTEYLDVSDYTFTTYYFLDGSVSTDYIDLDGIPCNLRYVDLANSPTAAEYISYFFAVEYNYDSGEIFVPWVYSVTKTESITDLYYFNEESTEENELPLQELCTVSYTYQFNISAITQIFIFIIGFALFIKFLIAFGRMVICKC